MSPRMREREREEFAVHVTGASVNVISNKQGAPSVTKYSHEYSYIYFRLGPITTNTQMIDFKR